MRKVAYLILIFAVAIGFAQEWELDFKCFSTATGDTLGITMGTISGATDEVDFEFDNPMFSTPWGWYLGFHSDYPLFPMLATDFRSPDDDTLFFQIECSVVPIESCWVQWDIADLTPLDQFLIYHWDPDSSPEFEDIDWAEATDMRETSISPFLAHSDYLYVRFIRGLSVGEKFVPAAIAIAAWPNPFNSAISISTPKGADVSIYDLAGRPAGKASMTDDEGTTWRWNPDIETPAGMYLIRVSIQNLESVQRIFYLK